MDRNQEFERDNADFQAKREQMDRESNQNTREFTQNQPGEAYYRPSQGPYDDLDELDSSHLVNEEELRRAEEQKYQEAFEHGHAPTQVKSKSNDEFKGIMSDIQDWIKNLFSPKFQETTVIARDHAKSQFTWVAILLIYILVNTALSVVNNLWLSLFGDFLGFILVFFLSLLKSVGDYVTISLVFFLTQLAFKEWDKKKWYEVLNSSSVLLIPRMIALILVFVLRFIPFVSRVSSIILTIYVSLSLLLYLRFVPQKNMKNASGIILLLMALLILFSANNILGIRL